MSKSRLPTMRTDQLPSVLTDVTASDLLESGNAWFGPRAGVIERNRQVVAKSTEHTLQRQHQTNAVAGLIEARMHLARVYGQLADLPNILAEEQRQREHGRHMAALGRSHEVLQAQHRSQIEITRHEIEMARLTGDSVRAQRNLEAGLRVKNAEIDAWTQAAWARRNEAEAQRQDTDADLGRVTAPAGNAPTDSHDLQATIATIDHEIELERQRGNAAAVMALQNVRARLKSAA